MWWEGGRERERTVDDQALPSEVQRSKGDFRSLPDLENLVDIGPTSVVDSKGLKRVPSPSKVSNQRVAGVE